MCILTYLKLISRYLEQLPASLRKQSLRHSLASQLAHTVFPRIIAWAIIMFFAQKGGDYWRKGDYFKCIRLKGAIIRGGARLIEGRL